MTDMAADAEPAEISDEALRAAIRARPNLVLDDLELMRDLIRTRRPTGRNVRDLYGVLLTQLETQLEDLTGAHEQVIDAAYANMMSMAQTRHAALRILEAQSLEELAQIVTREAPAMLDLDVARLCIEGPADALPRTVIPLAPGLVDAYCGAEEFAGTDDAAVMRRVSADSELIFGDSARIVESEGLTPLDFGADLPRGLLAFGADDPEAFRPDHGADNLAFLGRVVERIGVPLLKSALSG